MPKEPEFESFKKKNSHHSMDKKEKSRLFDELLEHHKNIMVDQLYTYGRRGTDIRFPYHLLSQKTGLSEKTIEHILVKDPNRTRGQKMLIEEHLKVRSELKEYNLAALNLTMLEEWKTWPETWREIIKGVTEKALAEKENAFSVRGIKSTLKKLDELETAEKNASTKEDLLLKGEEWLGLSDRELLRKNSSAIPTVVMTKVRPEKSLEIFGKELDPAEVDDLKAKLIERLRERRKKLVF